MATAVRIHSHGGPEVMQLEEIELAPPVPARFASATPRSR